MKYYNYEQLRTIGNNPPSGVSWQYIEAPGYGIYWSTTSAPGRIYKTDDEGVSSSIVLTLDGTCNGLWYDSANHLIRIISKQSIDFNAADYWTFDVSDDSSVKVITLDTGPSWPSQYPLDIFMIGATVYMLCQVVNGTKEIRVYDITSGITLKDNLTVSNLEVGASRVVVVGTDVYFYCHITGGNCFLYKYDSVGLSITSVKDLGSNTDLSEYTLWWMSYDGSDVLYFVLDVSGSDKLYSYVISTEVLTQEMDYAIAMEMDRFNTGTVPNFHEKGFDIARDGNDDSYIYTLRDDRAGLRIIAKINRNANIVGITDNYVIFSDDELYKYSDIMDSILEGSIYHSRQNYPTLKMKFNSDNISILPQMFIQIIGSYTADGSTTPDSIVFEGIAEAPTKGRIRYVVIKNQGSEMDQRKPDGSKSGDSDVIITDINDDGAPSGPEYIKDGTLASGSAMGTLEFTKSKTLRKIYNDFAEHDGFLWSLRPKGDFDYNAGDIDSGADLRYDGSSYTDNLLQIKAWTIAKLNQIIVNGGINPAGGALYTGQWDDIEDQRENGINPITIEDAQLNSDALCQTKADTMGASETERLRAQFKFRKTTYGLIQPGQTITFKYDVTDYMLIGEGQYILDKIIFNIKTEVVYAEISSGL